MHACRSTLEDPTLEVEGLVKVTEGGRVTGTIRAQDAAISGEVHGHVSARGRLELGASAHVLADVEAKTIAIAEGAFIAGRVSMPGGNGHAASVRPAPQTTSFKEKRRDRKKKHRAMAAAHAAAHPAPEPAPEPQADGDN